MLKDSEEVSMRFWRSLFNLADNMRDTATAAVGSSEDWNLTIQQMRLLRVVYWKTKTTSPEGVMLKTIAETLNVTSAAVCGMVESMVQKGLLSRARCESNRRSVNITLSDYSIGKIREFESSFSSLAEEMATLIGEGEFRELTVCMEKLAADFAAKHPENFHSRTMN